MKKWFYCFLLGIIIAVSGAGCAYSRSNRMNYYFTILPEGTQNKNAYSEKVFVLVKEVCESHGFQYEGRRDQDGMKKAFLFYNKSINVPCYYAWDTMCITIKKQPAWRFNEEVQVFLAALREQLQKEGIKYRYETKLFPTPMFFGGGVVNFSGDFVSENDQFVTEYHREEYPLGHTKTTRD